MRQISTAHRPDGLRKRLTDLGTIATAVELLRQAGYPEVAIWRHFVEDFVVDLDALSLIMKELFGSAQDERRARPVNSLGPPATREKRNNRAPPESKMLNRLVLENPTPVYSESK